MNKLIQELAEQAKPLDENEQKVRGLNSEYHDQWMEKFAELIVAHIVGKIEQEAEIAWAHEQGHTYATLLAFSLEVLEDFDMELPEEDFDQEGDEE